MERGGIDSNSEEEFMNSISSISNGLQYIPGKEKEYNLSLIETAIELISSYRAEYMKRIDEDLSAIENYFEGYLPLEEGFDPEKDKMYYQPFFLATGNILLALTLARTQYIFSPALEKAVKQIFIESFKGGLGFVPTEEVRFYINTMREFILMQMK